MALLSAVVGTKQILNNLKKRTDRMAVGFSRGVRLAGLYLQRKSQNLVPVDTGNLKASAFTRAQGEGFKTEVTVGYTAAYAIYVHENMEMKLKGEDRPTAGKYWDPQGRGQSKFLEQPAREEAPQMRKMIKQEMQK